jgi:hypothetical protein
MKGNQYLDIWTQMKQALAIGKLIISMMWLDISFNLQLMGTTLVFLEKSWIENCFIVGICNYLFVELELDVLLNMQEANC